MTSERVQRRIDRLLDQAEEAADLRDWELVAESVQMVLGVDPENADALAFRAMLENAGVATAPPDAPASRMPTLPAGEADDFKGEGGSSTPSPTSFAGGRYEVSKFLGEGGKKRVYQAHDTLLDREVAFALIKTEGFDQTSKERISREAQAMGRLGVHPNIVAVLDLGQEDDGSPYMVTELMGGGDVEGLLDSVGATPRGRPDGGRDHNPETGQTRGSAPTPRDGLSLAGTSENPETGQTRGSAPTPGDGLSLARTIEIGKAVCEGLEFAHVRGIVHRDLKPGNVWLTEDGTAKIGDFGLAMLTDRSRLTREAMMVGTVSYMPPEQATGGEITPKADVYSLGAMLYEMVTGRPPFLGDDEIAIIGQHINTPPVAPTWHNGACPRPLEALVMRMLAKDPSERPDSAQDVYNALDAIDLAARGETVEREANSLESLAGGVFVGRQAEMDQLKAALEDVLGGRGRLVTLVGEPGIGKTRTCEELATYAGLRGARVLWGRCYETGGQPPYWPWVQAIRGYVREMDPDELRRQMGASASVVAEIVADVKERMPELQPPAELGDPDSARFRLFDSITSFLKSASQAQPLVIVLDDLHWSDGPTLTFLEFVAREIGQSRVMIVGTYRDMELNRRHPLTITLGDLSRERLFERVLLRGLAAEDIGRFIEIAAGVQPPHELSATVHRHTEGDPLFVTEVVRDLVQSGGLAENRTSSVSTWSVRIPEGVREVIGRRLDRLSERANDMLTISAVIGRDFRMDTLKELSEDTTEGQLLDVLDEALEARIIEELSDEIGHYQFTHALMQETLTADLSSARKVRSHARIAEALSESYGDAADDHAAELVPHFVEAEPVLGTTELVRFSRIAGRQALSIQGYEEAEAHLQRVIDLNADTPFDHDMARTYIELAEAQTTVGKRRKAAEGLKKAFEYFIANNAPNDAIDAVSRPYGVMVLTRLSEEVKTAINLAPSGSLSEGALLVPNGWNIWQDTGSLDDSVQVLNRALEIADDHGDTGLKLAALAMLSNVYSFACKWQDAYDAGSRGVELISKGVDFDSEMRLRVWSSFSLIMLGDGKRGREGAESAVARAVELHSRGWTLTASRGLEALERLEGNWRAAREFSGRFSDMLDVEEMDINSGLFDSVVNELMLGQMEEGMQHATDLVRMVSADDGNPQTWQVDRALGAIQLARECGVDDAFEDDVPHLIALRERAVVPPSLNRFAFGFLGEGIASAELCSGDREGAERRLKDLESVEAAFTINWGSIDHIRGKLAILAGKTEDAETYLERGTEACRRAGYRGELAWMCCTYAELLLDRGDADGASRASGISDREKAIALQDEALAITRELGIRPLTERILARREILRA